MPTVTPDLRTMKPHVVRDLDFGETYFALCGITFRGAPRRRRDRTDIKVSAPTIDPGKKILRDDGGNVIKKTLRDDGGTSVTTEVRFRHDAPSS